MPTLEANGINIYYETHGEGEAVLLINGYGDSSRRWLHMIPSLSRDYRVVAFDNRGTGRSEKPDVRCTMETMAGDAVSLLDAIAIDAAHVFGVSMGGMIAQEFALHYPDKVISLILGCTHCGEPNNVSSTPEAMALLFGPERAKVPPEQNANDAVPFLFSQEFIDNNADVVEEFIARTLEYVTPLHGYRRQAQAIWASDTYDRLPQIKVPTLVIAGTADRIVPVENSTVLASRIPDAELVILRDKRHVFFVEAVEDTSKAVLDFLGRHRRVR